MATPGPVEEGALVDHLGASGHGRDGGGLPDDQAGQTVSGTGKFHDLAAPSPQALKVECLVLFAAAANHVGVGGVRGRPGGPAPKGSEFERGEARTGQMAGQVAGAEHDAVVDAFHDSEYGDGL